MVVQPYSGTSTFLPLLDNGELDFGINNAVDMALSYQGPARLKIGGRNPFQHTPNARLVMRGAILKTALLVRKDAPMKSVLDIRGKRLTGEYPAQLANWYNIFGFLTGAISSRCQDRSGAGTNEGVDALIKAARRLLRGRFRKVETDAAIGVRHISLTVRRRRNVCARRCPATIPIGSNAARQGSPTMPASTPTISISHFQSGQ
jgi:hypothetical protein